MAGSEGKKLAVTMPVPSQDLRKQFVGVLLGTAVGDALGLPAEGLSRGRILRMWHGVWRHRFLFGRGLISDDTEHTLFVAQALLAHPDDAVAFQRCLAWKLRLWLLGLPAGIGLATLKAILRLWLGFPPNRSGVWSAGNGPAMCSAIIGAYFADDAVKRRAFVSAATRLTHTDPKAETAALAVAEAAAWSVSQNKPLEMWLSDLPSLGNDEEWGEICQKLTAALAADKSVAEFAGELGLQRGVTGYAYHSVPVALYAWLHHSDDFRIALTAVLDCGGDTDTVGAVVGALVGARTGCGGIPLEWRKGICDQPCSIQLLMQVGNRMAQQQVSNHIQGPATYFWPLLAIRNLIFLITVLIHGFRRLLPPY
jgi:ADP-ribosylglycohydrolase